MSEPPVSCPLCDGEGSLDSASDVTCDFCDGLGVVDRERAARWGERRHA